MEVTHNGFTIRVWVDDDTNHAAMLRGKTGPERLYVDVDGARGAAPQTRSLRLAEWQIETLGLPGSPQEQLLAAGRWWVDAPDDFNHALELSRELSRELRALRRDQLARERV